MSWDKIDYRLWQIQRVALKLFWWLFPLAIVSVLFLIVCAANGATVFLESGSDATQTTGFYNNINGTVTSDSGSPITGPRSLKMSTGGGGTQASVTRNACMADAGRRISFRTKFDAIPPSSGSNFGFFLVRTSGNVVIFQVQLTNTGVLRINAVGPGTVNGTTVLSTNSPYRISVGYTITNSTTYTIKVYIDGKLDISLINTGTLTNTGSDRFNLSTGTLVNYNSWFDDIYLDDGTDSGDPGNIIVTNKRPNANGAANGFTTQIGSGGSGYGTGHSPQVNEQPSSTTNGWSITSASLITEEYTVEGASTGDIDVSRRDYALLDYMGWILANSATAGTRNIIVNGSASNISTATGANGTIFFKAAATTTYPSGNTAVGMNNNSVNNLTRLFEAGILLAVKLPRRVSVTP